MIYQLPNGRTINISIEAYLRMSDEELNYLNEVSTGGVSNNDFFATDTVIETPTIEEDYIEDLPLDFDIQDESNLED